MPCYQDASCARARRIFKSVTMSRFAGHVPLKRLQSQNWGMVSPLLQRKRMMSFILKQSTDITRAQCIFSTSRIQHLPATKSLDAWAILWENRRVGIMLMFYVHKEECSRYFRHPSILFHGICLLVLKNRVSQRQSMCSSEYQFFAQLFWLYPTPLATLLVVNFWQWDNTVLKNRCYYHLTCR